MATLSFSEIAYSSVFCVGHTQREREETSNRDRPYEVTTRECTFKFHGRANGMVLRRSWAPKRSMPICLATCPTTDQTAQALNSVLFSERTMSGLAAARARGRLGGRKRKLSPQQARVVKTLWDRAYEARLSQSSLAFPKTLLIASCDRSALARQSQ